MIPYIIIALLCVFAVVRRHGLKRESEIKFLEISVLTILFLFSAFTDFDISDTRIYKNVYSIVPPISKVRLFDLIGYPGTYNMEFGFLAIISIFKQLGASFQLFFIAHALFFFIGIYLGLKKYAKEFTIVIIFFLYKLLLYNIEISLRQSITIAIFFLIMHWIEQKKWARYMGASVLAMTIHSGAFVLIPFYFTQYISINKRRMLIITITSLLISFAIPSTLWLDPLINRVFGGNVYEEAVYYFVADSDIGIFHILEFFVFFAIVFFNYDKLQNNNPHFDLLIKMFMVMMLIMTVFKDISIITRFKDYFVLSYALLISWLFRKNIPIYAFVVCLSIFGFLRFVYLFGASVGLHPFIPYKSFLI